MPNPPLTLVAAAVVLSCATGPAAAGPAAAIVGGTDVTDNYRADAQVQYDVGTGRYRNGCGATVVRYDWTDVSRKSDHTATLAAGDAFCLIDRNSTGASNRPPAGQVTISIHAHQNGALARSPLLDPGRSRYPALAVSVTDVR